tara:strand:- start:338 stop:721 length:384 start_codon:yes stop_codon:yes gene_type:complete
MTVLYGNKPLPHAAKSAVIQEFLQPEYQDTAHPDYKGMEFLLQTFLPEGNYSVYDVELISGWVDYMHHKPSAELVARVHGDHFVKVADFSHDGCYHSMYKHTKENLWALAYNGCSAHGQLMIYFFLD